jgi:hypothetical protein
MGVICATGRPRSVMVTVSPAWAWATTAEAFCFKARIPTSLMCYIVAPGDVVLASPVEPLPAPFANNGGRRDRASGSSVHRRLHHQGPRRPPLHRLLHRAVSEGDLNSLAGRRSGAVP